jgi:hypothetical protein
VTALNSESSWSSPGPAGWGLALGPSLGSDMEEITRDRSGKLLMFLVICAVENECCRMEEERVRQDHRQ